MLTIFRRRTPLCALLFVFGSTVPALAQSSPSSGWDMALTGGFVASGLTDPVWALGTVSGSPIRVVVRQTEQESDVLLGAAMFVQVHHDKVAWIAPLSFGVGLRDSGRAVFYFGSALRMGPHASSPAGSRSGRSPRCRLA